MYALKMILCCRTNIYITILKAPFLMKYVTANATGGTIKHLNQSILVDFPIPIGGKA